MKTSIYTITSSTYTIPINLKPSYAPTFVNCAHYISYEYKQQPDMLLIALYVRHMVETHAFYAPRPSRMAVELRGVLGEVPAVVGGGHGAVVQQQLRQGLVAHEGGAAEGRDTWRCGLEGMLKT